MDANGSPVTPGSRILHLCAGQDTGGQAIASKFAFAGHDPTVTVNVVTASRSYIGYPLDPDLTDDPNARGNWRPELVERLYADADVVVIHRDPDLYERFDKGQRKPIVIHHHGTHLRRDPASVFARGEAIGARQVVSTVDLLLLAPGSTWLPQIIDIERMRALRDAYHRPDKTIRIAHAPTDRIVKGTATVEAVISRLKRRYPVVPVIIERLSWDHCLARKATADIYVDQFGLGYGNNAIEAWAMGMPVIAGASAPILARMRREYRRKTLPFYEATVDTLEARLVELIESPDLRAEWAQRGMEHVERFHAPAVVVARLKALYASVPPSVGGPTAADLRARSAEERRLQLLNRGPGRMRRRMQRIERQKEAKVA